PFAWADLRSVWPQWIFEFSQHGAHAYGIGRTIHWRAVSLSLLLGRGRITDHRRRAIAFQSVRAFGAGAAGTGDCEHPLLSRVFKPRWRRDRNRCHGAVVHCLLWSSQILRWDLCPTSVMSNVKGRSKK